jgi:hypothetical protein
MKITKETFLRDVKDHQMTILKDDGVFRCIEFRNPADRGTYFFYLTTFPGRLVISGDCGTAGKVQVERFYPEERCQKPFLYPVCLRHNECI